jgi:hypothetical protein
MTYVLHSLVPRAEAQPRVRRMSEMIQTGQEMRPHVQRIFHDEAEAEESRKPIHVNLLQQPQSDLLKVKTMATRELLQTNLRLVAVPCERIRQNPLLVWGSQPTLAKTLEDKVLLSTKLK